MSHPPSLGGSSRKNKPSATIAHFGEGMSWRDFDFLDKLGEGYVIQVIRREVDGYKKLMQ
jgi:hypothetical protein